MRIIKLTYILLVLTSLFWLGRESAAQQVPIYSQYMFNKFILNPAVAGSEGYTAYNLTSRVQWLGFKDAPITNAVSAQTRLIKSKLVIRFNKKRIKYLAPEYGSVGIGMHVYNDRRGSLNQTGVQFTFAYHEKIEFKEQLSFGISLCLTQFKVNTDNLIPYETDPYLNAGKLSVFIPDFNVGSYYVSQRTYVGVSVAQLFQSAMRFGSYETNRFRLERNYNVMGGYRIPLNSTLAMEPSFQFKTTEQFFYQVDGGCRLYYKNEYWGGISYRTGSALIFTLGLKSKNLFIGYAYDWSFNSLQTYSIGTNELIVCLKFAEYVRKYKWIERF